MRNTYLSNSLVFLLFLVADLYNLSPYDMVTVSRVENEPSVLETVSADFVAVTIKDQFISRGDMHFFQKSLIGRWIYEGERLSDTRVSYCVAKRGGSHVCLAICLTLSR